MKRRVQGLHDADHSAAGGVPDGLFLVRVDRAQYRGHAQRPYYLLRCSVTEPHQLAGRSVAGRLYCTPKALWKLTWFLRDFGYDAELPGRDEIDDKSLVGLRGIVKISHVVIRGTSLLNFDGFAPASKWQELSSLSSANGIREVIAMTSSYTHISQYLTCPRRYRHRYLDGWEEKDARAAMLFGRAFERALSAYFLREDAAAALFRELASSTDSARTTASAFVSRGATCRSSSRARFPRRMTSWPTSTRSGIWTGHAA